MANEQHLAILKQGVASWNAWRQEHPKMLPDFGRADLSGADLTGANLGGANLGYVHLNETVFANVDLRATKGLETCQHHGPSILDHRTLKRSGRLPLVFLRGCGLPDRLIDYLPSLLEEAIQYYSCFISYSSKDEAFAKRLHADLQNNGVRCWFAPHDLPIGARPGMRSMPRSGSVTRYC